MSDDEQLSATQRYGVIPQRTFMEAEDQKVVLALSGIGNFKHVERDDFVISLRSFQGGIEHSAYVGCVSPAYTVLRAKPRIFPKYWAYLLKCAPYIEALQSVTAGIREGKNISYSQFGGLGVPVPPLAEQEAIACYLDKEVANVDTLIAEQEKLIALLAEKRQATITQAVTRGLDPDVPLKDSGISRPAQVPVHWKMKKLRHIATIVRGASPRPAGDPRFFADDDAAGANCPWVTVAEVTKDDAIYLEDVSEYLTPDGADNSQHFQAGTLIFTNSGATLGVPKVLAIDCCANDGILAFKQLSCEADIRYVYYFLTTTTERLRTEMKQGGGQPNLNTSLVKDIPIPLPSHREQVRVVEFLRTRLLAIDELRSEAERQITLLRERRGALIAAAVTGKIDVRRVAMESVA